MTTPKTSSAPSRRAFNYPSYKRFWFAVLANTFATQIMSVAIAWQVYDTTRNPLYLGLIGLVQFMPALLLVLVTGLVADRFNRRAVLAVALVVEGCGGVALLWFALSGYTEVGPIFIVLLVLGISRAFMRPAESSLAPNLVPPAALPNAITLNATAWQLANIVGPMAGGLLFGISSPLAFGVAIGLVLVALVLILSIAKPVQRREMQTTSVQTILAGFRYVWHEKVVLGAISLDLFAVLLGGAVALLPVYAIDILDVGPWGLGLLRGAPGVGAIIMAIAMAKFPVRDHAGKVLLGFVTAFGFFTIIFGFSTSVWIAVPALFLMGGTDMVSVVMRETMLQLWTPDPLRGRVNAVNAVFVGASNELGEFRAGLMAFWIGTVTAVVIGGAATMAVAASWYYLFPDMRRIRFLDKVRHKIPER